MASSSTSFKVGNKVNLGKRNAAREYRTTFARELFEENRADIKEAFKKLVIAAKNGTGEWLEAMKILAKHFVPTPPPEVITEEAAAKPDYTCEEMREIAKELTTQGFGEAQAYKILLAISAAEKRVLEKRKIITDHSGDEVKEEGDIEGGS